jgi:hypothetical protein
LWSFINVCYLSPKFELPTIDPTTQVKKQIYICDFCGDKGHKASSCFKSRALNFNPELLAQQQEQAHFKPLAPSEVTCYKCGEKGHYANRCNKSAYAFLRGGGGGGMGSGGPGGLGMPGIGSIDVNDMKR